MEKATALPEAWRPVPGFEGFYEVSSCGRVRSVDRVVERSDGRRRRFPGVLLTPTLRLDGRYSLPLCRDGQSTRVLVAALVLSAFDGPRPLGLVACHRNGKATDDRVENLRWDTQSSNNYDRVSHGNDPHRQRECCPLGHPLVVPNLVPRRLAIGHRVCLACNRARCRVWRARRRGVELDLSVVAAECLAEILS